MIEKKRSNDEIVKFLSGFEGWISARLQKIEIVKLSIEHIKQTEIDIQELKNKIAKTKKEIKDQDKIYKSRMKDILKLVKGKNTRFNTTALFEPTQVDGIEIFQVIEEDEENIEEQEVEDEI